MIHDLVESLNNCRYNVEKGKIKRHPKPSVYDAR